MKTLGQSRKHTGVWSRHRIVLAAFALLLAGMPVSHAGTAGELDAAAADYQAGRFDAALTHWKRAEREAHAANDGEAEARALLGGAQTYLALGRVPLAMQHLASARELTRESANRPLLASILVSQGNALALTGESAKARESLKQAILLSRASNDQALLARGSNDLARLAAQAGQIEHAARLFREAMAAAASAQVDGSAALETTAAVNLARLPLATDEHLEALANAERLARALPASHLRAMALISIARLRGAAPDSSADSRNQAIAALESASADAQQLGDRRVLSYALGYQGALEETSGNLESALRLTRNAAGVAQLADAPESLYLWEWQAGRLLRRLGDQAAALTAYRVAANTLERIRPDLAAGGRGSFRTQASPVYQELTDLLLHRAQQTERPEQVQADLREARRTMEALKGAELEDFFQDDCVAALKSKTSGIDTLASDTAAIYPIVLPDRLAILISLSSGLRVYSSPVGARELEAETRALRRTLEKRTTREYLQHARKLFDWVLRPTQADLDRAGIKTLVFVPDGALRTIPLSALHDGKSFLIERYAVATSPGLTLTDPRPLASVAPRVLMAGLTESVQGYAALPGVKSEIDAIASMLPGTVLQDNDFQTARFRDELSTHPYTIVHVASHGEFGAKSQDTFLLTHDGRITFNELEALLGGTRYRDQPVELLALSACQTAAGDDRAALGLAGVAVKAGARGALATLWSVSDAATMRLIGEFYRHLGQDNQNKANALREAQLAILADRRFRHPYYWSPFLLIGNWL